MTFAAVVGLVLLGLVALRVLEPVSSWWAGLLVLLPAVLGQRLVVLSGSYVGDPVGELRKELRGAVSPRLPATSQGPLILLVTVDTLRWDKAQDMESVQRIAAGGGYWPRAMATSSWTLPSLASLMTGVSPGEHGAGASGLGYRSVNVKIPLLAEQLRAQGYATAAFGANPFASSSTGLERGFDLFFHVNERAAHRLTFGGRPVHADNYWAGEGLVDRAVDYLDDAPERGAFVWVHLLDVHLPHRHASEESSVLGWRRSDYLNAGIVGPQQRQDTLVGYASEVAYIDQQVLRLLDALAERGLEEEAVILFTADHGEELWDHGDFEHGHSHAGQVIDVPLALRHPGFVGTGEGVASLVDVAPTLLAAAGLPALGIDLAQGVPAERIALAVGNKYVAHAASARQGTRRVVQPAQGQAWWVDLAVDPQGLDRQTPLASDPLLSALGQVRLDPSGQAAKVELEALRALGYLE
jgi:arylsulfatase